MCLQCASQGEKDEDHCKTTCSGGQNGVLTRVLKRTMELAALMGRLQFLLLELLSTNTCVNTYASARKTHSSKCTKTNLSKAFRANHGAPANISEPSFQHALVFWIKTAILWTKHLCPFQRCLNQDFSRKKVGNPPGVETPGLEPLERSKVTLTWRKHVDRAPPGLQTSTESTKIRWTRTVERKNEKETLIS